MFALSPGLTDLSALQVMFILLASSVPGIQSHSSLRDVSSPV